MTTIHPVAYNDDHTGGFRIYDPKPLLIVTDTNATVVFIPNYSRGYAVNFHAWLAKNTSSVKQADGGVNEMNVNLDSSDFLNFLGQLGQKALEQAATLKGLSSQVGGAIADRQGVYEFVFDARGDFTGLRKINMCGDAGNCDARTAAPIPTPAPTQKHHPHPLGPAKS